MRSDAGREADGSLKETYPRQVQGAGRPGAMVEGDRSRCPHSDLAYPAEYRGPDRLFGKDEEPDQELSIQGFRDEFETLMTELDSISRVVVLVDDLDRCLPHAVIGTLEAIKLFLSVPKMGFVIAADERVVPQTIATQYQGAAKPEKLGRQYVEKIVQIPLRVPALGESDTKAYLALLLLHRHFHEDAAGFQAIVDYARREARQHLPRMFSRSFPKNWSRTMPRRNSRSRHSSHRSSPAESTAILAA